MKSFKNAPEERRNYYSKSYNYYLGIYLARFLDIKDVSFVTMAIYF